MGPLKGTESANVVKRTGTEDVKIKLENWTMLVWTQPVNPENKKYYIYTGSLH